MVLRKNMRSKAINVKYWFFGDKKCHFGVKMNKKIMLKSLFSYIYDNIGLAQKLQYF
jgi:hypothetical protein